MNLHQVATLHHKPGQKKLKYKSVPLELRLLPSGLKILRCTALAFLNSPDSRGVAAGPTASKHL